MVNKLENRDTKKKVPKRLPKNARTNDSWLSLKKLKKRQVNNFSKDKFKQREKYYIQ
jgi:hypothetical protein